MPIVNAYKKYLNAELVSRGRAQTGCISADDPANI